MAYYILKSYRLRERPFTIFRRLARRKHCFFLDSSLYSSSQGRYSFIGADPFFLTKTNGKKAFGVLRRMLERFSCAIPGCDIPFIGGAVGYLSYDAGKHLPQHEPVQERSTPLIPEAVFGFYNTVIVLDRLKGRLSIIATGFPQKRSSLAKALCRENMKKMQRMLAADPPLPERFPCSGNIRGQGTGYLKSSLKREEYLCAVRKAKEYIRKGDIYQVNLSQRFEREAVGDPVALYGRLRAFNPTWFGGYFDGGDFQLLSASPERFLAVKGNQAVSRPMKGTRMRGRIRREDEKLKRELMMSATDKAELLMIVDLVRNDLGRVCEYGSIEVPQRRTLEKYATVFQTTATVSGTLHPRRDPIDLLHAAFPGGSVTGCPKIRAMEIIEELEPVKRSFYTGCFGYVSFSRQMDFNILIRSMVQKEGKLYFGVGGGIVADSRPRAEYEETLIKAQGLLRAMGLEKGGS